LTVSRHIGRGGARKGAGRKKKPTAPLLSEIPRALYVPLALATLIEIALNGKNEDARRSATEGLISYASRALELRNK
jgi:hypothetical protein